MNVHAPVRRRRPLKLRSDDFLLLRASGAFRDTWRPELLDGRLFGTPRPADGGEPESDAYVRFKLTIEHYLALDRAGAFRDHEATELIDGEVFAMSPQFRPHGMVKMRLYDRLRDRLRELGSQFTPVIEFSLAIAPGSMPIPDIMLTSEPDGPKAVPVSSVVLLVEVADTTLEEDLGSKRDLYAGAEVPEYWVADVNGRVIHRMWSPRSGDYERSDEVNFGEMLGSTTLADLAVDTSGL